MVKTSLEKAKKRNILDFKPGNSRSRVVFYNRIGKCGSRSIIYMTKRLSKLDNYTFSLSRNFEDEHPSEDQMLKEMKTISELKPPVFYNRHIHFLDFKKYGYEEPIYINIIRDPVERFSSQYNYVKYGDGEGQVKNPKSGWPDINECVMKEVGICQTDFMFYIGMYFCGFDKVCESRTPGRVELAKKHIDENYAVIGLLEEFEKTLKLFQRMLPEYFLGALSDYKKFSHTKKRMASHRKDVLTNESIDKLRNHLMKDEYEVYFHAKQRYEELKRKYGIWG